MPIKINDSEVCLGVAVPSTSGGGTEINNEDVNITSNGEYSASEGYTGIGTATVNVPAYSTITATNNTGAAITSGDKVWLNNVSGGWNMVPFYATDLDFKYLNYRDITFVGAPNVDYNLNASNFSASNYFTGPTLTNIDTNHCIIYFRFALSTTTNAQYVIDTAPIAVIIDAQKFCVWNNRTENLDQFFSVSSGINYWVKVVVNGAERTVYYKISANADYTLAGSQTVNSSSGSFVINYIGYRSSGTYLHGTFFFGDFEIHDENDNIVWTAYKYDINTTDKSLSGYALENIASGATGNVKTVL